MKMGGGATFPCEPVFAFSVGINGERARSFGCGSTEFSGKQCMSLAFAQDDGTFYPTLL